MISNNQNWVAADTIINTEALNVKSTWQFKLVFEL